MIAPGPTCEHPARERTHHRGALFLLLPQPPLSFAYLLALRSGRVEPSFTPVLALAVLPAASCLLVLRSWRAMAGPRRLALLAAASLEIAWAVLSAAIVGFAIAWRSG